MMGLDKNESGQLLAQSTRDGITDAGTREYKSPLNIGLLDDKENQDVADYFGILEFSLCSPRGPGSLSLPDCGV